MQRFAVFIDFWARSLDFACDKVRIVDLSDRQKCLVLFVFVCVCVAIVFFLYGQDSPNVTHRDTGKSTHYGPGSCDMLTG